jgi:hypothetical protein
MDGVISFLNGVSCFFWLAATSFQMLALFWPGGLLFCFGVMTTSYLAKTRSSSELRCPLLWSLTQLMVPAAIITCGVLFWWDSSETPPDWPDRLIWFLPWGHLPLTILLVLSFRRCRWLMLAVSLAYIGYTMGALVTSGMAVTGDWP